MKIDLLLKPYRHAQLVRKVCERLDEGVLPMPPVAAAAPVVQAMRAVTQERAAAPAEPSGIRILVVEDNDDFRDLICELITLLGYQADSAASAEQALAAIAAQRFDILLTDVNLPGLSGIVLAERFKAALPHGGVIFSSGVDTGEVPAGDTRTLVLRKPYGIAELKAAIARVLAARV